jgi:signal peptidase I
MLKDEFTKFPVQLVVLFATLALFLITNALFGGTSLDFIPPLIAAIVVVEIFLFVGLEVKEGAKDHGWKHEVVDTLIALGVALGIWYGTAFLLNTDSPVSGVVSCSMLPNLQRGDFVVVQGVPARAYEISMNEEELDSLTDSPSMVYFNNQNVSIQGSLFSYCSRSRSSKVCQAFTSSPQQIIEKKGSFTYRYEMCNISLSNGSLMYQPCLKSITFKGQEYLTNFSNDIIVYQPPPGDLYHFIGDIVHRAMFRVNVDGEYYYITRGDNNPVLDMQVFGYNTKLANHPIPEDYLRGRVIARIPILGYFKLFIAGYIHEDPQCRTQLEFTHVS